MPSTICPHPELARGARLSKGAQAICNALLRPRANKFSSSRDEDRSSSWHLTNAMLDIPHPELGEGRTTLMQRAHREGAATEISAMSMTAALTDCDMKQRASTWSMARWAASRCASLATTTCGRTVILVI